MFDLKRPCVNCPFRRGQGELFGIEAARLREIVSAPAFQCHKTVDYGEDEPAAGSSPQQCAGLMSMLHQAGRPNQIMQVAERLGAFDPAALDHRDAYATIEECMEAHGR